VTATPPSTPSILFAGGGTGGHLSPGLAVSEVLRESRPGLGRVFACSTRAIDALMLSAAGETYEPIHAAHFGRSPRQMFRFVRGWRRARREARALLERHRIVAAVALGGFVAAPVVAEIAGAAPILLLNLDAVPGKANRLLAKHCDLIVSTCATPSVRGFASHRVPMPLRKSTLSDSFGAPAKCRDELGLDPHAATLVVTGASQGSQSINDLMRFIVSNHRDWLDGWQVLHLCGEGRSSGLVEAYEAAGVPAVVLPFLDRMGLAWGAADLAISRGGANSVAEIAANAVPAVFLPYPHHRDRHQYENARPLVDLGGAVILDDRIDPGATVAANQALRNLLHDQGRRSDMRRALEAHRPNSGAGTVADILLEWSRQADAGWPELSGVGTRDL